MTPSVATGLLDRAIARDGQTVIITRNDGSATQTVLAVLRGYRPDELTGDITQGDRKMILSPTFLTFTPAKIDQVAVQGVVCSIEAVDSILVQDAVVRIECQVRG